MKIFYLIFLLVLIKQSQGYYIQRFVGYGQQVPNREDFVQIKPDNQPYIGIEEQSHNACQDLTSKVTEFLKDDTDVKLSFIGYSQGGLVARHVFMTCEYIRQYVKRIITYGTPNLGIDKVTIGYSNQYNDIDDDQEQPTQSTIINVQEQPKLAQNNLNTSQSVAKSFLNFAAQTYVQLTYQENQCPKVYQHKNGVESKLIAFLNFEGMAEKEYQIYQFYYQNLELFITLGYTKENMISILESPLFGSRIFLKQDVTEEQLQTAREYHRQFLIAITEKQYKKQQLLCQTRQDYQQCINDLNQQKQLKITKFEKEIQEKFYLNQTLYVENFHASKMKQKYIEMFQKYPYPKPENQLEIEKWQQEKQQYYNQINIPLADTLESLYKQKKYILCAVTGFHLQNPHNYYYDQETLEFQNFEFFLDHFAYVDKQSENYEFLLNLVNCNQYNNNLII